MSVAQSEQGDAVIQPSGKAEGQPPNVCPRCRYRGAETVCPHDGFPMVAAALYEREADGMELVGQTFGGRYQVEKLVGRGGMGWVYRARHVVVGHMVALKVLKPALSRDETAVRRFYQEARACSRLTHPNTIKVHDFGATEDGHLFIAMEYLRGRSLKRLVREEGALSVRRVLHIADQICKSLDEAHEQGMVHRDLKPENIYLTKIPGETDYVKVIDFGIARVVQDGDEASRRKGAVMGTPKYMSPEQARGLPLDRRSDLYSLGILLYEMLTGQVPFTSTTSSEVLVKHLTETPAPIPTVRRRNDVPKELLKLVDQLLAKESSQRPATADAVRRVIQHIQKQLPPDDGLAETWTPSGLTPGSLTPSAPTGTAPTPMPLAALLPDPAFSTGSTDSSVDGFSGLGDVPVQLAAPRHRGRRLPVVLLVALLVVGAAIATLLALRSGPSEPAAPPAVAAQPAPAVASAGVAAPAPAALAPPSDAAPAAPAAAPDAAPAPPAPPDAGAPAPVPPEAPPNAPLRLESRPSDATVSDGSGRQLGKTPLTVEGPAGSQLQVVLRKKGHRDVARTVTFGAEPTVSVDLPRAGKGSGAAPGDKTGSGGGLIPDF